MKIDGSTEETDRIELRILLEESIALGMTAAALEDELATRTGFEDAVRGWMNSKQTPNGLVRRIILNNAKQLVRDRQRKLSDPNVGCP